MTRAFDLISTVDQHRIQDATKLTCMYNCPRRYFFEYVLGWRPETPNNHLVFGAAWHKAMEVFALEGYSAETVLKAYGEFLAEYRKTFGPDTDELFFPKTPDNAFIVLAKYAQRWAPEDRGIKTLHVEVGGRVLIREDAFVYFKMDTICEGKGIFSREHKTDSSFYMWEMQWPLCMQIGVYSHVLHCMFPQEQVVGIEMNGAMFNKKAKKGWAELATGSKLTVQPPYDFMRLPIKRNRNQMTTWLWTAQFWYDFIQTNFQWLSDCSPDDNTLTAFPMNPGHCTAYNGCPWFDFCNTWANPLAHCEEPPLGYIIEHWDPSKEEVKMKVDVDSEGNVITEGR